MVSPSCVLPLTEENVEKVLDEVRPGLMADGGNVALHEIDGLVVVLKLQGACGSCPSSTMTLKMGIETRLRDKIPEIMDVEQILDNETGLELNEENVEKVRHVDPNLHEIFVSVASNCFINTAYHYLSQNKFLILSLSSTSSLFKCYRDTLADGFFFFIYMRVLHSTLLKKKLSVGEPKDLIYAY